MAASAIGAPIRPSAAMAAPPSSAIGGTQIRMYRDVYTGEISEAASSTIGGTNNHGNVSSASSRDRWERRHSLVASTATTNATPMTTTTPTVTKNDPGSWSSVLSFG